MKKPHRPESSVQVRRLRTVVLSILLLCLTHLSALASPDCRVWETNIVLPTYLAAPASPVPRFYEGRTYQGAKATFYPYPVQDVLTDVKSNVSYKALFLENQYLQISVLPELGGRIFSAVDKVNGYDFFYRQHVIKPALIGMLGAWISGGVEWNVPHHHRATSFSPVDYTTQTNADGSATIWVGEVELRHRMKWLVGMTLYPDRSDLELTCKMLNPTPFAHPMLFWINAAVHANTNYQVIFPPSTEWAAQHSKPEFASWPIARQVYGGTDYTRGVDISRWENHPSPVSFFAWNYEDDWFGGYDHGRQAGVVQVADHRVAPGKKFFEWGNGPEGEMWTKILSDEDGPYLELMAGAWSDNQPDYSWIQPGETREWKHWWYPIRNLGGVKAAAREVAVNLEITNGLVKVAVQATLPISKANVDLRLWGTNQVWRWTTNLNPQQPFLAQIPATELGLNGDVLSGLGITVLRRDQPQLRPLVDYTPKGAGSSPRPKPVEKPKSPGDYATTDELYFTGQRIEQLCSPSFEAQPYYQEILRRDPGDSRANTALGILLCKQWRWEDAAKYLSNAVARAAANYVQPKDGEAFYYLGVALKAMARARDLPLGDIGSPSRSDHEWKAAETAFGKAAWSESWRAVACFQLAEIACVRGDFEGALGRIENSLAANARNPKVLALKAAILRRIYLRQDAARAAEQALAIDPLDPWGRLELALSRRSGGDAWPGAGPDRLPTFTIQQRLEIAIDYANAGLGWEAGEVARGNRTASNEYTLLNYYQDVFAPGSRSSQAPPIMAPANEPQPLIFFPYQHETVGVLEAVGQQQASARAKYLLGCLLYDNQPERAIKAWEESRQRNAGFALVHRNLALGYSQHEKNIPKAIASLETAIKLDPKEPRFFYELDRLYEANGAAVPARLAILTRHRDVVAMRDDALTRELELLLVAGLDDSGKLDHALEILAKHHFRNWEGSGQIHSVYVDACLTRGRQRLAARRPQEALRDFAAALDYPENLEVGRARRSPRIAQIGYWMGAAHEAMGKAGEAKAAFEKAAAAGDSGPSEGRYFQALALQKLGKLDQAKSIFERLVKAGEEQLTAGETADYFAKFGEKQSERVRKANAHYLTGLGRLGLGDQAQARTQFQEALELHPAHLGAAIQKKAL